MSGIQDQPLPQANDQDAVNQFIASNPDLFATITDHIAKNRAQDAINLMPAELNSNQKNLLYARSQDEVRARSAVPTTPQTAVPIPSAPSFSSNIASALGSSSTNPFSVFDNMRNQPAPESVTTAPAQAQTATVDPDLASVDEAMIRSFMDEIETYDEKQLLTEELKEFEYQGFNPEMILKTLLVNMRKAKIGKEQFLKDVNVLCALAIIKGSVNDNNLKKMSDKGKARYDELEKRYGITRGGGRGKPAEVVTVARIAAAFPGNVIKLLHSEKVDGRKFISDLRTHELPGVLRHQALAACIPQTMGSEAKNFLLDLVTAFSVDQTKVISKSKEDLKVLIDRQSQFTLTSHNGQYPSANTRKTIINLYNWGSLYDKILPVATHIKTKWTEFEIPSRAEFLRQVVM